MKLLKLLLSALLLAAPSQRALAELTDVVYTPDPSETQTSLSKITLQFMDANYGISGNVDVSGITLSRKGSTEVLYALAEPVTSYAKLFLEFGNKGDTEPVTVNTEGIWTLHIPAGAVTSLGANSQPNAAINVDYTVSPAAETPMTAYTLNPAAGKVDAISTITLAFPKAGDLDWFYNNLYGGDKLSAITLTKKGGAIYTAKKKKFDGLHTITLAFADASGNEVTLSEPGTYELHVPADMFQKDFTSIRNDEIKATYTISAPIPADFTDMTADPADGAVIGQMQTLTLTFPNMSAGLAYPQDNVGKITLTGPSGNSYHAFNASISAIDGIYKTLTVNFVAEGQSEVINNAVTLTGAGAYTITLGEGAIKADNSSAISPEMQIGFTIDPERNFTYTVTPKPDVVHDSFTEMTLGCGNALKSIAVKPSTGLTATIALDGTVYNLTAVGSDDNKTVTLTAPADAVATPGDWTVTVPAGFLRGVNNDDVTISNHDPLTWKYLVREADRFAFTLEPAEGTTVEFFKNLTVKFEREGLKKLAVNTDAGKPVISGDAGSYNLVATVNTGEVSFAVNGGELLPDGNYTITIPKGYILTYDSNKLSAEVEEITTTIKVKAIATTDYSRGILFLNEGWYGHDSGSLNFLGENGTWVYDAFMRNNSGHSLGITSQYGQCFGNDIYVVSKDAALFNGVEAGQLVVMDAATLAFKKQIYQAPGKRTQGRAFCAWNEHKGYLSCNNAIYVVNLDTMDAESIVPGTDVDTSFDSNAEILRYGDYLFAVRQSTGIDVINPENESVFKIPAELSQALVVLPDGSMIAATTNESNEFIRISPTYPFEILENYDIDFDKAKIAKAQGAWHKPSIAVSTTANEVYYVTLAEQQTNRSGARTVARYNFDTKTFTPDFIKLPCVADGNSDSDWCLYGEGVSVDPATGNILLMAVKAGRSLDYRTNMVFVADPETGAIDLEASHLLKPAYWFPAMALYPDFKAPVIDAAAIALAEGPATFSVDLTDAVSLTTGNPYLMRYNVRSLNPDVATVTPGDAPGMFDISVSSDSPYSIEVQAEYQGKTATQTISYGQVGITGIEFGDSAPVDVYNTLGVCVMRAATPEMLRTLVPGIYIAAGRKFIVR